MITSVLGCSEKPEVAIIALPNEWRTVTPSIKSTPLSCNDHCSCHLPQYTLAEVSEHYHDDDCWIVLYDKVYDVTKFMKEVCTSLLVVDKDCKIDTLTNHMIIVLKSAIFLFFSILEVIISSQKMLAVMLH
jgi:cytochrome b5, putative